MKAQERIRTAVAKAQKILTNYIHPGKRECEETINELAAVLDDEKVVKAMNEAETATATDGDGGLCSTIPKSPMV